MHQCISYHSFIENCLGFSLVWFGLETLMLLTPGYVLMCILPLYKE